MDPHPSASFEYWTEIAPGAPLDRRCGILIRAAPLAHGLAAIEDPWPMTETAPPRWREPTGLEQSVDRSASELRGPPDFQGHWFLSSEAFLDPADREEMVDPDHHRTHAGALGRHGSHDGSGA